MDRKKENSFPKQLFKVFYSYDVHHPAQKPDIFLSLHKFHGPLQKGHFLHGFGISIAVICSDKACTLAVILDSWQ